MWIRNETLPGSQNLSGGNRVRGQSCWNHQNLCAIFSFQKKKKIQDIICISFEYNFFVIQLGLPYI